MATEKTALDKFPWQVGDPIKLDIKGNGFPGSWIGYIRRIDYGNEMVEVAPENLIDSHLSIWRIDQLVATSFTDRKNSRLAEHIDHLKQADKIYAKKHDKAR